jgi:hypothetical protein
MLSKNAVRRTCRSDFRSDKGANSGIDIGLFTPS